MDSLSLFLFDTDLEKGFLNVSTENHWSKSCSNNNAWQFVLKGCPLYQTFVNRIPRPWFGKSTIYYSQFCWLCPVTALYGRKNSFGFSLWFSENFSIMLFTNWSLINWSYALNVSGFCLNHFKSDLCVAGSQICCFLKAICSQSTQDLSLTIFLISLKLFIKFSINILIMT